MSPVPEAPLRITVAVCAYVLLVVWVTLRGLDNGLRRSGCARPSGGVCWCASERCSGRGSWR